MKNALKFLTILVVAVLSSAAYAADKGVTKTDTETTSAPPKDATTYPCWDMMQNGQMQHMHGMMNGNIQTPPQDVKAHTCWDAMQNGQMMHMHNMQMMWNATPNQPNKK